MSDILNWQSENAKAEINKPKMVNAPEVLNQVILRR